jgi:hypothetical protein
MITVEMGEKSVAMNAAERMPPMSESRTRRVRNPKKITKTGGNKTIQ